jgi:hypothetical protein
VTRPQRAAYFMAELWRLTMFCLDYRVPQMLHTLGVLSYSPPLESAIRNKRELPAGHTWEVQLRGCSIWAVELIRQEIVKETPEINTNAVLIDFFLYDAIKDMEAALARDGKENDIIPHHRTRSIWY